MATDADTAKPLCPWSSFYRPSDIEQEANFFKPLSYLASGRDADSEDPVVPDPRIFTGPESISTNALLPTPADCATHLQLLQCFLRLRFQVISSTKLDAALGITPWVRHVYVPEGYDQRKEGKQQTTSDAIGSVPVRVKDPTYTVRRQDKWSFFLGLAASRFLAWISVMQTRVSNVLRNSERDFQSCCESAIILPPIDVLMVWHAMLLDPKLPFKAYDVTRAQFPWQRIHEAITSSTNHNYGSSLSSCDTDAWDRHYSRLGPHDLLGYLESQSTLIQPTPLSKALKLFGEHDTRGKQLNRSRGIKFSDLPSLESRTLNTRDKAFLESTQPAFKMTSDIPLLISHVQKQSALIDKMDFTNWLASPALEGTLKRAIDRYGRFMKLFKFMDGLGEEQRKVMLVPTLDIDLVWLTSRCTSRDGYKKVCQTLAGRFIDPAESPRGENGWYAPRETNKPELSSTFVYTSELYKVRYGAEYNICLCWECEALKSAMEDEDEKDLDEERDIKEIAHEVLVKVTRYRVAEEKRRAAAVQAWSNSHWPDGAKQESLSGTKT